MTLPTDWRSRAVSPEDAVALVKSRHRVFVHGAMATPTHLLNALTDRMDLEGVQLYHLHTSGECRLAQPRHKGHFFSNSLFTGPPLREPIADGRADFVPVFLSDIPQLFESGKVKLDVALLQLSLPDKHGDCTLGPSIDAALAASTTADLIIAEINDRMPRTTGNTVVPFDLVDAFICTDRPLVSHDPTPETEIEARIGDLIAPLVKDGSTLQMGIGAIPDAVLRRLGNKHDLGIHSEMFSDGVIDLYENGVITNREKEVHRGRIVTSFVSGSQRLIDFVDDNLMVEFYPCDRTNDPALIKLNPKVVAINSALEIDLTGQVCADSIGHRIYSGIGGQMDFIRGATLSKGGVPVIAIPSTAAKGTISRITTALKPGAGVVTTRGHVHWVVTEYGAVDLHGLALRQRAEALISIAHPDFRADLWKEVVGLRHFSLGGNG